MLRIVHPLSGNVRDLSVEPLQASDASRKTLDDLVRGLDPVHAWALAVWRLWRERLGAQGRAWGLPPANTRLPDHTSWNHNDTAMGCRLGTQQHSLALLAYSLAPVQPFIAAARTVRDLWAGSYLLAWLAFAAIKPILDECGPAAMVSPALRGNPLMDQWLRALRFEESPGGARLLDKKIDEPNPRKAP